MDKSILFKFVEICSDKRGLLNLLNFGNYEALLSYTMKGKSRSGYYFKKDRIYVVLSGSFLLREKNMKTYVEIKKTVKTGDHFTITPSVAHMFTALENSYMIEFTPKAKKKAEMIPYKPYREVCEKDI